MYDAIIDKNIVQYYFNRANQITTFNETATRNFVQVMNVTNNCQFSIVQQRKNSYLNFFQFFSFINIFSFKCLIKVVNLTKQIQQYLENHKKIFQQQFYIVFQMFTIENHKKNFSNKFIQLLKFLHQKITKKIIIIISIKNMFQNYKYQQYQYFQFFLHLLLLLLLFMILKHFKNQQQLQQINYINIVQIFITINNIQLQIYYNYYYFGILQNHKQQQKQEQRQQVQNIFQKIINNDNSTNFKIYFRLFQLLLLFQLCDSLKIFQQLQFQNIPTQRIFFIYNFIQFLENFTPRQKKVTINQIIKTKLILAIRNTRNANIFLIKISFINYNYYNMHNKNIARTPYNYQVYLISVIFKQKFNAKQKFLIIINSLFKMLNNKIIVVYYNMI
eukprot:TRINITY_DN6745_c0_g1_i8.p2 TRINITY_DN6745_c0_g1~~TRINITY_DN6745_c0_g1_i8.p2  ORF type:complete len:388 (-),score=-9.43 TRINITY_DN6745_c0_g1_i8:211-1374(-)